MSYLHKEIQVTCTYDTNVECQICSLCYYLFLTYADNTYTQRTAAKIVIFGFRESQNILMHQNLNFESLPEKQNFLCHARSSVSCYYAVRNKLHNRDPNIFYNILSDLRNLIFLLKYCLFLKRMICVQSLHFYAPLSIKINKILVFLSFMCSFF